MMTTGPMFRKFATSYRNLIRAKYLLSFVFGFISISCRFLASLFSSHYFLHDGVGMHVHISTPSTLGRRFLVSFVYWMAVVGVWSRHRNAVIRFRHYLYKAHPAGSQYVLDCTGAFAVLGLRRILCSQLDNELLHGRVGGQGMAR